MKNPGLSNLFLLVLLSLLFCALSLRAEIYRLDLQTAREMALEKNPDLLRSLMDLRSAEASFALNSAGLLPQLTLDLTTPSYNENLSEQYIYQPQSGAYAWQWVRTGDYRYQGSLNLEQKLPTGGTFTVSDILYKRDYFFGSSSDSLITEYSNAVRFSVQQPLLQFNQVRYERRQSLFDLEVARLNRQIRLRDLDFVISSAYYALVRADGRLNLEKEDFDRWQSSVKTALDKFNAGLIPEVEVLKLKVELARREGSLASVTGNYLETADNLKLILGLELNDSLVVSSAVEEIRVEEFDLRQALGNREELKKAEIDVRQAELNFKQTKANSGLDAYVSAYYDLDAKQEFLEDLVDNLETDRGVSLTLALPLFDWGIARNQKEIKHITLKKNQFNQEQLQKDFLAEIASARRSLDNALRRLRSARLAEELALKSYEITRARFDSGAVTAAELIDAQISLNQSRNELLDSTLDYNITAVKYNSLY